MSDKLLSEVEWKKFAKGKDLKDAALLKALAAVEKSDKAEPAERLAALDDLEKQSAALRKAYKADKKLADHLDEMDGSLAKQRKLADQSAKSQSDADAGDDDDSPAVLTTKMVPLMRQVTKGDVTMHAMVAMLGKQTAVLVARRPVGPPQRKLLTNHLGTTSGVKFVQAQCIWERNAHTFIVAARPGGLAKSLKAALFAQTEQRYKVRVRGDDPDDVEEDLDDGDDTAGATSADAAAPGADAGPGAEPAADPAKAAYEARHAELEPLVLEALRQQHGDVSKLRALLGFAAGKAEAGQFKAALQGLESLAKLLGPQAPAAATDGDATVDPGQAFTSRLAALMPHVQQTVAAGGDNALDVKLKVSESGAFARKKDYLAAHALLDDVESLMAVTRSRREDGMAAWQAARQDAIDELQDVIDAVRDTGDPEGTQVEIVLRSIVNNLTESPATPQAVVELKRWLATDDVITAAEEVPPQYGSLDLRGPLLAALAGLE